MASVDDVLELLVERLAGVMATDAAGIGADTRFDEDLHADSLDLVEVVEAVERTLRERGEVARIDDDELLGLRTVGDAAERIAVATAARDADVR